MKQKVKNTKFVIKVTTFNISFEFYCTWLQRNVTNWKKVWNITKSYKDAILLRIKKKKKKSRCIFKTILKIAEITNLQEKMAIFAWLINIIV